MGLLDDAIREHLELKRRRGGDPTEIERAEREALGPVRREPEPIQPSAYDEPEGAEHERAPAFEDDGGHYEQPYDELAHDELDDPYPRAPSAVAPEPEPRLPHGAAGTGPSVPPAPEPPEVAEEHDPWVSHPASERLDDVDHEPLVHEDAAGPAHGELEAEPYDMLRHDPLPEPVAPPPVAPPPPGVPPARSTAPREPGYLNQETAEYHLEPESGEEEHEDMLEETPEFLQDAPEHDRLWFEQRPPRDFDFDN